MMHLDLSQILSSVLHPKVCWLLASSLMHSLWQGVFLGVIASLIVRNKTILNVHQRFVALFSILVLISVLPVANVVWILGAGNTPDSVAFATKQYVTDGGFSLQQLSLVSLAELAADQQIGASDDSALGSTGAGLNEVVTDQANPQFALSGSTKIPPARQSWLVPGTICVTLCYLIGVGFMLARLVAGLKTNWKVSTYCQRFTSTKVVPDSVAAAMKAASQAFGRTTQIPVALFQGRGAALVVGCLRPVILVNSSIVSGLTPDQIELILAHELAHLHRFDPLTQLIQRLIESVLFFHPVVWFVSRHVSDLRELCCDDLVSKRYCRFQYANTLVACAGLATQATSQSVDPRFSLAATGTGASQLVTRIEALLVERSMSRGAASSVNRFLAIRGVFTFAVVLAVLISNRSNLTNGSLLGNLQDTQQAEVVVIPTRKWQTIALPEIDPDLFMFGGKQLKLSSDIPADVKIDAMVNKDDCKFGQWHFGDANSTRVGVLVEMDDDQATRLFIDSNRDRVIGGREQVNATTNDNKTWVASLNVEVFENNKPVYSPRQIGLTLKRNMKSIRITTLGYSQGEVELDGTPTTVRRVDLDGNGLPNDSRDQIWFDFDHDGEFSLIGERKKLTNFIEVAAQRYAVRSDRLGQSLKLTAENDQGTMRLLFELASESATLLTLEGSLRDEAGMLIAIRPQTESVSVPPGRYCVENLIVEARDAEGYKWRMTLARDSNDGWFEVKTDEQTDLQLLDSIQFALTPEHQDDPWDEFMTRLKPKIYTANGLTVTNFTCDKKKKAIFPNSQSVAAKLTSKNSETGVVTDTEDYNCKSGFS